MRTARTRLAGLAPLVLLAVPLAFPVLAACGNDAEPAPSSAGDSGTATPSPRADGGGGGPDGHSGGPTDGGDGGDGGVASGPPPSSLPVTFQRPDVGTPLTPAEIDTATTELIAILKGTRYFDLVDERVHGWPETDPSKSYWYGHWWSGITVTKSGSTVTFRHSHDGADNNGIQTAPYLEGACYGYLMWGDPKVGHLARRMARAYTAWIKAMVRSQGDTNPTLLARAFYHPNVTSNEGGRTTLIDYSQTYPGIDADPSEYVHIPTNPTFGDIWIKNKRSKDDIGQILRSISQFLTCGPRLDAAGQADAAELKALYTSWAKAVDANGFGIQTLDKSGNLWTPPDQLAHYSLIANLECLGALAVRLRGGNAPGNLSCGTGFPTTESLAWNFLKNDARQIVRTNHAAAILLAYEQNQLPVASELLTGLGQRLDLDMNVIEGGSPPQGFTVDDATSELVFANNVGVPLTSREVRWLHGAIHQAHAGFLDPALKPALQLFDPATPDGTYDYELPRFGIYYRDLGMLLGACASPYRNPAGRTIVDCQKLLAAF